jgi:hypothetical protein
MDARPREIVIEGVHDTLFPFLSFVSRLSVRRQAHRYEVVVHVSFHRSRNPRVDDHPRDNDAHEDLGANLLVVSVKTIIAPTRLRLDGGSKAPRDVARPPLRGIVMPIRPPRITPAGQPADCDLR